METWNFENLFKKKLVFIPIHIQDHWMLSVIVNPGLILKSKFKTAKDDDPIPCILFFDSLNHEAEHTARSKIVARTLRKWLNFVWAKHENATNPFTAKAIPLFTPSGRFYCHFEKFENVSACLVQFTDIFPLFWYITTKPLVSTITLTAVCMFVAIRFQCIAYATSHFQRERVSPTSSSQSPTASSFSTPKMT